MYFCSWCGLASVYSVVKLARLLSAGLDAVPPGSPMMMSAAQCVLLARSAARAERTESSLLRKLRAWLSVSVLLLFCCLVFLTFSMVSFGLFCLLLSFGSLNGVLSYAVICLTTCCYV